jgi:hypothetical protein
VFRKVNIGRETVCLLRFGNTSGILDVAFETRNVEIAFDFEKLLAWH